MIIPFPSRFVLKPSIVSMAAMFASLAAWLFPSFGTLRKGFDTPARPDFDAFAILACWYILIFLSFSAGEKVGELLAHGGTAAKGSLIDLDSNLVYYSFTLLTAIGIFRTLLVIFRLLSFQQAMILIAIGQANSLKNALYEEYSVGLVSLRYLILFSASIALYRMIRSRSFSAINIFNVFMLVVSTLILGSRLIFIATLLTATLLLTFGRKSLRISIPKTVALLRVGASVAIGSSAVCLEWSAGRALAAGASEDEIADVLLAIIPVAGLGRVVTAAPDVATALGYDVAAALEEPDDH